MSDRKLSADRVLSCADVSGLAFEYLDGEMTDAQRAELDTHIGQCQPCHDYMERERGFLTSLRSCTAGERCPDAVRERIRSAMRQRRESQSAS